MRFTFVFISVAVLALSGCSKQSVTQTDEGVFVLGSVEYSESTERGITPTGRTILLKGFSGNIQIQGVAGENAAFTFVRKARANSQEGAVKLLEKIGISEAGDETTFTVTMSSPEPARTAVDIVASIPAGTPVTIVTKSSNVALTGLNGPTSVRNEAGSITFHGASANLDLKSRNGDVIVTLSSVPVGASINLETSNGNIQVSTPAEIQLGFDATTSAGVVQNTGLNFASTELALSGAGGHFQGRVGTVGSSRLIARTYHGDILFGVSDPIDEVAPSNEQGSGEDVGEAIADSLVIPADSVEVITPAQIP